MFAFKLKSGERECTDYNNVINSSSKLIWTRGRVAMVNIILNKKLLQIIKKIFKPLACKNSSLLRFIAFAGPSL